MVILGMELWSKGGHGPYMFVDSEETNLTKAKNGQLECKIGEVAWRGGDFTEPVKSRQRT